MSGWLNANFAKPRIWSPSCACATLQMTEIAKSTADPASEADMRSVCFVLNRCNCTSRWEVSSRSVAQSIAEYVAKVGGARRQAPVSGSRMSIHSTEVATGNDFVTNSRKALPRSVRGSICEGRAYRLDRFSAARINPSISGRFRLSARQTT